jgi:hypothetical protein
MSQPEPSGVASAAAAGVHVVQAVLWRVRDRADRAAAELLVTGPEQVDEKGELSLTDRGRDLARETPLHPVPAALPTTLRRHTEPVAPHRLHWDTGHEMLGRRVGRGAVHER